ncbi:MAG: YgcG family protein [Bacteroidales bacterium]|nr:YgcG family protein [Bacteroidales bacterium]
MKKIIIIVFLFFCAKFLFAQEISVPVLEKRVTDLTETLSEIEISNLETTLKNFEDTAGSQVVVLLVSTTGEETIEEYSMRVAEAWKIGREGYDDGVILLVAKDDRKLRIEVGYGLESVITDADASSIIENYILPEFKNGNFYLGLYYGITHIVFLINGGSLYNEDLYNYQDEEEVIEEATFVDKHPGWFVVFIVLGIILPIVFFFVMKLKAWIIIIIFLTMVGFNLLVGLAMGGLINSIVFLVNTVMFGLPVIIIRMVTKGDYSKMGGGGGSYHSSSSYNSSSYNSSSSSSYSSSSSSSSSSYSGGGGSFGGGGASGSW